MRDVCAQRGSLLSPTVPPLEKSPTIPPDVHTPWLWLGALASFPCKEKPSVADVHCASNAIRVAAVAFTQAPYGAQDDLDR
jgi:hypothetical protein